VLRRAAFLLLLAALAACATPPPPGCTAIGRDGAFCPLPPAQLPQLEGNRLVKVTHDGKEDDFMGLLKIDSSELRLAGFTLFGTSLFNLTYDGAKAVSVPDQGRLKPDVLVAMLEFAVADPALLEPRLEGLSLKLGTDKGGETRDLYEKGKLIVHVERSAGPLADAHLSIDIPPAKLSVEMVPTEGTPAQP
jgi:hypothetical protein